MCWFLPVFGLTGSIASGKSELLGIFAQMGAHVIDADRLGHELMYRGRSCHRPVVERFGPRVLTPGGSISRAALARLVFDDPQARAHLEAILHPAIVRSAARRVRRMARQRFDVVILEAALLYESGLARLMLDSVAVLASRPVQMKRLVGQRRMDEREATLRLDAQWSPARKARRARWVVHNDGSLDELENRAGVVLEQMRSDSRVLAARARFG